MEKCFNTTGVCYPDLHYMVDLQTRLYEIKKMIDIGKYFCINRARQYGKTTTLQALCEYLADDYYVIDLDFQALSHGDFENEEKFIRAFARHLVKTAVRENAISEDIKEQLEVFYLEDNKNTTLNLLFDVLSEWCQKALKPIVLMIDEVDSASGHRIFLDFLAQLRLQYLSRRKYPAFQSVVLAGVYDIKSKLISSIHSNFFIFSRSFIQ